MNSAHLRIRTRSTRNAWLEKLYAHDLVRCDEETMKLADKLYAARKFEEWIGPEHLKYLPKTLGLREFVLRHGLNFSQSPPSEEAISKALQAEFPHGVLIKPCAVINTGGESPGYFFGFAAVLKAFTQPAVQTAARREEPYVSPLLKRLVSGEEFILQEDVPAAAGFHTEKAKTYAEIRIHTYGSEVLRDAMFSRWAINPVAKDETFDVAREMVTECLSKIPANAIERQAWALDVLVLENGYARIIDVNTNRGKRGQWSGYLTRPELIGAYTRKFERSHSVRFAGLSGVLLRNNWGNYFKYLRKYYIEGIR